MSSAWRTCVSRPTRLLPARNIYLCCASSSPPSLGALKQLCQQARRGQAKNSQVKEQLMKIVQQVNSEQTNRKTTGAQINATWELLWTTEKETLFILGFLDRVAKWQNREGHKANVYQIIDVEAGYLQNVIEYDEQNAFIVNSDIEVQGKRRIGFNFVGAQLKLRGNLYKIPPFGKGWFDTVYMDKDLRIAQDIRGDTLVVSRGGPPKRYT